MKVKLLFVAIVVFLSHSYKAEAQVKHDFICIDNFKENQLIRVNELHPEKSWKVEVPKGSRDLQLLPENKLLVSHGNGAAIFNLETGKQIKLITNKYSKIQSAQLHENGFIYLLSIDGKVFKLNKKGEEISRVKINRDLDLRLFRSLDDGNLLISCKKPKAVMIVDLEGNILKEIPLRDKGYKVLLQANGNYLSTFGDEVKVAEHNEKGEVLNYVGGIPDHKNLKLDYASGWDLLPNGNIVLCNWLGHDKHGTAPHLIEFTRDNKVVWLWEDHKLAHQITNVLFLN